MTEHRDFDYVLQADMDAMPDELRDRGARLPIMLVDEAPDGENTLTRDELHDRLAEINE